jgi:hypothetical protein
MKLADIPAMMDELDRGGDYLCAKYDESPNSQSWLLIRRIKLLGKECDVHINSVFDGAENAVCLIVPFYEDGGEGVVGESLPTFDSLIIYLSSRLKSGQITKYTYDETFAPVYTVSEPLSRMDPSWYRHLVDYCVDTIIAYRPLLDGAITKMQLSFTKDGSISNLGQKFLAQSARSFQQLLSG